MILTAGLIRRTGAAMRARSLLVRCRRPDGWGRAWLGMVLALTLATRLLVPQGWMPSPGGGLMMCSGAAMPVATMHHGKHETPKGQTVEHPCAFAGLGLPAAPPPPIAFAAPIIVSAQIAAPLPVLVAVGRGLAAPPPPQTGPPAFA